MQSHRPTTQPDRLASIIGLRSIPLSGFAESVRPYRKRRAPFISNASNKRVTSSVVVASPVLPAKRSERDLRAKYRNIKPVALVGNSFALQLVGHSQGKKMRSSAKLVSIATAVPPHVLDQRDAAAAAHRGFASRYGDFERLASVFASSGIRRRHTVRPLDWYFEPLGWPERNKAYLDGACALFVDAATKALDVAGLRAAEVDTVVTISSTGIATPSLEARAAGLIGFRPDFERVPVFGLGCAGGVSGFSIAARLAQSRPGSVVLLVAVEVCTLSFRLDELTKANIVATALFGDGSAACVIRAGETGIASFEMGGQHTWPDTLDIMGWNVDPQGFGVIFDRAIPPFAEEHIAPAISGILGRAGLCLTDIDRFACHPGGAKVITALERALSLGQGALDHERTVLADYGNMSAPTALFVLEHLIQAGLPPRTLLSAMGPGFTVSSVSLQRAA
jgi:alkylresorcinol/alkylpyrone synthase